MPLESIAETAPGPGRAGAPATAGFRIYYVEPALAGPPDGWDALLERVAGMGFGHILIAPPFSCDDPALLDRRLGGGEAQAALAALAERCRARGLGLLVDVSLAPEAKAADPLDPRAPARAAPPDLSHLKGAACDGFRLTGLDRASASEAARAAWTLRDFGAAVLLADAQGLSPHARAGLRDLRLDGVFSSLPWWDFASEWLQDETEELSRAAPVLAAPEQPFGPRLATRCHDPALLDSFCRRAIGFAAMSPGGWMLPMGCEFASPRPLGAGDDPADFDAQRAAAVLELSRFVASLNTERQRLDGLAGQRVLSAPGAPVLASASFDAPDPRRAGRAAFALTNASLTRRASMEAGPLLASAGLGLPELTGARGLRFAAGDAITLEPGESLLLAGSAEPRAAPAPAPLRAAAVAAGKAPRIAIEAITPSVDDGRFPSKRVVGDTVIVEADVVVDGHDQMGVALLWRRQDAAEWSQTRMRPLGNDRWRASFPLAALGAYLFTVEAWRDAFATFRDELAKKHAAGVDTALELREGRALAQAAPDLAARLDALDEDGQRALLLSPEASARMAEVDPRPFAVRHEPPLPVSVDRPGAAFAAWYEIFPRSMSDDETRHGTFDDVIRHLPRVRDMGFDVLYFPPIHPIGRKNRKGRNNTLTPGPDDPGSPYAIGSADGGHDSLHPQLGTFDDFRRLREAAEAHGLELAIDFAVQCSPDHPWLSEHKDWFAWRPDGTIRYAENPPKKYEDIVNVDFYAPGAIPALWEALCEVVLFWAGHGVRLFRVDNPHTKPFPFWEWLIAQVRARHPDAVFLAEAFTRPKVMTRLAKIGFGQSYTYFTWRNTKAELTEYLTELSGPVAREVFRPHFFVNTPDINPVFNHESGRPGFLIRSALAATLSGLWGLYCGFELCEARRMPGKEEYLDSEKYQLRAWDWDRPGNIVAEVARLNRIRRANPALRTHLDVKFHAASGDQVLYYEKSTPDRSNCLLIAVSLDPFNAQEADIEVPLWEWGLPDDAALAVEDLARGGSAVWRGKTQRIRLDPSQPYAIWRARPVA